MKNEEYVDISFDSIKAKIGFEDTFLKLIRKDLFTSIFIEPLTNQTTIRYEREDSNRVDFHVLEDSQYWKIADKISKKLKVPLDRYIVFKGYSSKKGDKRVLTEIDFDTNLILYKNEEGVVTSLLHVLRNALAHGNVFDCCGGVVFLSFSKTNKVNGIVKLKNPNDTLKLIEMLKNEVRSKESRKHQ